MWSSDEMIQELKNRGKRITKQRKIMVEVIASKKMKKSCSGRKENKLYL